MDVQLSAMSTPERLEAMRAYMLGWRLPMDLRPLLPLAVTARSYESDLGAVCLLSTNGSGATVIRDARLARDDTPPLVTFSVLGRGTSVVTQHDRAAHLRAGDMVAYTSTAPFRIAFDPGNTRHSFMIPADTLRLPVSAGDESRTRDLLGASLDTRILEYLQLHLADRDLSAARIAAVHAISERHLYTVLARCGISLRTWLREQRLTAASRDLALPAYRNSTIAAVAHRWGFADHAHFTREFRRRFGVTPTEWRRSRNLSMPD